jgi:hypothetical protein
MEANEAATAELAPTGRSRDSVHEML